MCVGESATGTDGAEFQPTIMGWGMNHSTQSWAGADMLWEGATLQAFVQSKALWKQELAVEMSMSFGGLGGWHVRNTPLALCRANRARYCVCVELPLCSSPPPVSHGADFAAGRHDSIFR